MAVTYNPAIKPQVSTSSSIRSRALVAQFGDGYEQRIQDGINSERMQVNLVWKGLTHDQADAELAFFSARGAWERFDYQLPWETRTRKWRVGDAIRRTETDLPLSDLRVPLVEVFDL